MEAVAVTTNKRARLESASVSTSLNVSDRMPVLSWTTEEVEYPQIQTNEQVVCIPSNYLAHSGVEAPQGSMNLFLYKRKPVQQLWDKIQHHTIDRAALLSIFGAPGAGKSSAAYAFASGLVDRTQWVVVWLHFVPRGDGFLCVKFDGNTKSTGKCTRRFLRWDYADQLAQTTFGIAEEDSRGVVVFLDGFVDSDATCASSFRALKAWSWEHPTKRRFVCVRSMVVAPEFAGCAQAIVTDGHLLSDASTGGNYDHEVVTYMSSWMRDDFYKAVEQDAVLCSVQQALEAEFSGDLPSVEARRQLIDIKYHVAGGSVRFMFAMQASQVARLLEAAASGVHSMEALFSGTATAHSMSVVRQLLASYTTAKATIHACLVSPLASRLVAASIAPAQILLFAEIFWTDPQSTSVSERYIMPWLIASLVRTGVDTRVCEGTSGRWPQAAVGFFDPSTHPFKLGIGWNFTTRWHPGGFDAIKLSSWGRGPAARVGLTFVRVVTSKTCAFSPEPFCDVLKHVWTWLVEVARSREKSQPPVQLLERVELYYALPWSLPFCRPIGWKEFAQQVVAVAFPDVQTKIDSGVSVIGLKNVPPYTL